MTFNETLSLFESIATAHNQINSFEWGELWEVEGHIKPSIVYPLFYAIPVSTEYNDQVYKRTWTLLTMSKVDKAKNYERQLMNNAELILTDVIKILRNESNDYEVDGDPQLFPFKEEFGDWVCGYRSDVVIISNARSNYCDVPKETIT